MGEQITASETEPQEKNVASEIVGLCEQIKGVDTIVEDEDGNEDAMPKPDRKFNRVDVPLELKAKFGNKAKLLVGGDIQMGYQVELSSRQSETVKVFGINTDYPLRKNPSVTITEFTTKQLRDSSNKREAKHFGISWASRGEPVEPPTAADQAGLEQLKHLLENAKARSSEAEDKAK